VQEEGKAMKPCFFFDFSPTHGGTMPYAADKMGDEGWTIF
jgi:hypothetical protein